MGIGQETAERSFMRHIGIGGHCPALRGWLGTPPMIEIDDRPVVLRPQAIHLLRPQYPDRQ